jgi:hypothetical protein
VLGALARWGFDWAWSAPRPGEAIDIGAVLRLAPGLLAPPASVSGRVECIVDPAGEDGTPARRYVLVVQDGRVAIVERDAPGDPGATVAGAEAAWVRAFGPDGDASELELRGDRDLAGELLSGLTGIAARAQSAAA